MKKPKKSAQKKSHQTMADKLVQAEFSRCFNLGTTYLTQNNLPEAQKMYLQAIELRPEIAETYNNLGIVLQKLKKVDAAIQYHTHALVLKPSFAEAHQSLGMAFSAQKNFALAIEHFQKALALRPNYAVALNELFYIRLECCDWTDYADNLAKNLQLISENKPFRFLHISSSAKQQQRCAQIYSQHHYFFPKYSLGEIPKYQHEKIRIAYLSADFREHAVSFLIAGLLERHNREHFEIIAVSFFKNQAKTKLLSFPKKQDATTERIKKAVDKFIDASEMADDQIAKLMREMEIDIAVDLMGFTQHCRAGIFAYRPAPIHINYLGFAGTMGTGYMDYIFADPYLIPSQYQADYTEKIVYLPDCFQVNDDKRVISSKKINRLDEGLPETGFVFCSFNTPYKITPVFFDIWMRLLKAVPNSVLWLLGNNEDVQKNLRNEAVKRGVSPERLIFASNRENTEHLARLQLADLFLDTLPVNAGATASDVLWAGSPIITCSGEAIASRMAGSLLHAIGLPELIANNLEEYEALALKLATTPQLLAEIKAKLAKNRTTYPLFNTDRFRKHIEAAYMMMWERYQRGEAPESFAVPTLE